MSEKQTSADHFDNPLVSVIVPVYNMEALLGETLESVLKSDYPHLEIIVMDDGSTDRSKAIADSYSAGDGRVKSFSQSNGGVSRARNNAIKQSMGKYILPVDADDLISHDYIKGCVEVMEDDLSVKMAYGKAEFFGARQGEWRLPDFNLRLLARKNIVYVTGMYRRIDFDKTGGYCDDIAGMEDWDFWIALLKDGGRVVRLNSICFHYRISANSKRSNDLKKKRMIVDKLNERHRGFFNSQLSGKLHYNRTWSRLLNRLGIDWL